MPRQSTRKSRLIPACVTICLQLVGADSCRKLEALIGRRFRRRALLAQAMVHNSCHVEVGGSVFIQSNERLEQLGDKVLGLAVCNYVQTKCPDKSEQFVAPVLDIALSNKFLAEIAQTIGLMDTIVVNKTSQVLRHPQGRQNVLADAMEAIIGAVFSDGGCKAVDVFLARVVYPRVDTLIEDILSAGPKPSTVKTRAAARQAPKVHGSREELQQLLHGMGRGSPKYDTSETGNPDQPILVRITNKDELLGEGAGKTRKRAADVAAAAALKKLKEAATK